jgi:hypothetical protein
MDRRHNDWDEDWEDYQSWRDNVEYVMTVGGLERVDKEEEKVWDEEGSRLGEPDAMEEFKKSKEELRKQIEKQQRELDEKKKELEKATDSTKTYRYKTSSVNDENDEDATSSTTKTTASFSRDITINPLTSIFRFLD